MEKSPGDKSSLDVSVGEFMSKACEEVIFPAILVCKKHIRFFILCFVFVLQLNLDHLDQPEVVASLFVMARCQFVLSELPHALAHRLGE